MFSASFKRIQLLGILIGLAGATGLILSIEDGTGGINLFGLFVVLATVCYAISINIIRNKLSDLKSVDIAAVALFLLMIPSGFFLLTSDFLFVIEQHPEAMHGLGYLSILGVVGTSLALILYNRLIKATSAIFASSVTYIIPLVALMWGVLDGERVGFFEILFGTIIISGINMINTTKGK